VAAIQMMSALAQPTRLTVFTTLSRHPRGLQVGELAKLVDTPANTMSTHLSILARAGVVLAVRAGRVVTYTVAPKAVRDLTLFLIDQYLDGSEKLERRFHRSAGSCLHAKTRLTGRFQITVRSYQGKPSTPSTAGIRCRTGKNAGVTSCTEATPACITRSDPHKRGAKRRRGLLAGREQCEALPWGSCR
jgi:DNA-binding transcriptional ArsR family regulator